MKKIIFSMLACAALITTSCTNDDIEITNAITFKVNPATVVENLYEAKAGDLTSLSSGAKLHVTLFIYDEKGNLINNVSNEYSAYTHMMTTDINLPIGNYTAVATSYVTGSVDYWTFSDIDKLSTFKITDNGYVGGKSKILGLTIKNFNIASNSETVNINIENAGAVSLVKFDNWNKYSDVSRYALLGKQADDYITFDNQGNPDYSLKSRSTYDFIKIAFDYNSEKTGATGYFFTFPITNASFSFSALTSDNEWITMATFVDDVKIGETYLFEYDIETDETFWYDMTPSNASAKQRNGNIEAISDTDNDRIVYDYEGQSISIK